MKQLSHSHWCGYSPSAGIVKLPLSLPFSTVLARSSISPESLMVLVYSLWLAVVGEAEGEVEVLGAQELHNGLEVVFAAAHDAHGIALNLRLYFGQFVADEGGD